MKTVYFQTKNIIQEIRKQINGRSPHYNPPPPPIQASRFISYLEIKEYRYLCDQIAHIFIGLNFMQWFGYHLVPFLLGFYEFNFCRVLKYVISKCH